MGLTRLELVTPRLSSVCSNQLSYRPLRYIVMKNNLLSDSINRQSFVKEVIQPQVPPTATFYDFTPVIGHTVVSVLPKVRLTYFWCNKLPWCDGRCVQGPGKYSPRRSDPRMLAIPTSWSELQTSIRTTIGFLRLASQSQCSNPLYRPL